MAGTLRLVPMKLQVFLVRVEQRHSLFVEWWLKSLCGLPRRDSNSHPIPLIAGWIYHNILNLQFLIDAAAVQLHYMGIDSRFPDSSLPRNRNYPRRLWDRNLICRKAVEFSASTTLETKNKFVLKWHGMPETTYDFSSKFRRHIWGPAVSSLPRRMFYVCSLQINNFLISKSNMIMKCHQQHCAQPIRDISPLLGLGRSCKKPLKILSASTRKVFTSFSYFLSDLSKSLSI